MSHPRECYNVQLTGGKIGDRLMAEAETNLAINVRPGALSDSYEVLGRGELQLGLYLRYFCFNLFLKIKCLNLAFNFVYFSFF